MRRFLAAVALASALLLALIPSAAADEAQEMQRRVATSARGEMAYWVYVPPGLPAGSPLFVHVHGGNNAATDAAHRSGLNALAREFHLAVVYPQEDPSKNSGIWDAPAAANEGRGSRAPALIAQITRAVVADYHLDPKRVFIGGISAGSGMAIVTAAQYPELYAGVEDEAGSKYGAGKDVNVTHDPTGVDVEYLRSVERTGKDAAEAMGKGARRIPFIRSTGTLDPFHTQPDQVGTVQHWLVARDWVDDGERNDSVSTRPTGSRKGFDGKPYTVTDWADEHGCLFAQEWVITGLFHAYSGGHPTMVGDVTADPKAPDMRRIAIKFFLDQTDADGPPGCAVAAAPTAANVAGRVAVAPGSGKVQRLPASGGARWPSEVGAVLLAAVLVLARIRQDRGQ